MYRWKQYKWNKQDFTLHISKDISQLTEYDSIDIENLYSATLSVVTQKQ